MRILWLGTGFLALAALVWGGYEVSVPAVVLNLAVGLAFIGAGIEAADRRPDSLSGQLMIAVGLAWFVRLAGAVESDWGYALGVATKTLYLAVLGHLLVTYPAGRITSRWQRVVVSVAYLLTVPVNVAYLVLTPFDGPQNIVVIREAPSRAVPAVAVVVLVGGIVLLVALLARMITRWLRSGSVARRDLGPVVWGGAAIVLTLVVTYVAALLGLPAAVQVPLQWSTEIVLVGWPLALLYGLVRARLDRSAVGELAVSLGAGLPGDLRSVLARTLHDPSLEIVYGEVAAAGRGVTYLEAGGVRLAALVHDPALDPVFVRAVAASAALAVQNSLRAQRIVEASDEARRQVERDLHDGAQQRLVGVLLTLRLAEESPELVAVAREELARALDELRSLARGIYPVLLTDAGLGPALLSLAERSAVPVVLAGVPEERLSAVAERTCYFVVAEALTNAVKHARAGEVRVVVACVGGLVTVEVSDDGIGGVDLSGSGVRGLDDRVAAVGGRLTVWSVVGEGTILRAEFSDLPR
ncbi:two-component sensor histidine kinase [Lentzea pudingi]|uniref:histidine kinase n=1 Tax=Lentzea pudingi TaxID=1789439 RepID=A0ABQ2IIM5_9PSEU|nr:ATP-binding protein [Lentzea pudingi]GGN08849.1 two-component sensor histidine kinase [Lentzea pudingi]